MDVIFVTHASEQTGFGHAARCANICKILIERNPKIKVGFYGEFSGSSWELVNKICQPEFSENLDASVIVYDRMDNKEEPHQWNEDLLQECRSKCNQVIFLANSHEVPKLPEDVVCIGYKLGQNHQNRPMVYWGLKYAPTNKPPNIKIRKTFSDRNKTLLIAMGGGATAATINKILSAAGQVKNVSKANILMSPVNQINEDDLVTPIGLCISTTHNAKEIWPILENVDLLIASYGHLAYEAMAIGIPTCLVGQKVFQTHYADKLAEKNLCISAGLISEISVRQLSKSIMATSDASGKFSVACTTSIDANGVNNISDIISDELNRNQNVNQK